MDAKSVDNHYYHHFNAAFPMMRVRKAEEDGMLKYVVIVWIILVSIVGAAEEERGLKSLQAMKKEQRVALVVGNNTYKNLSDLKNPINDARAMRDILTSKGFEVLYAEDSTLIEFKKTHQTLRRQDRRRGRRALLLRRARHPGQREQLPRRQRFRHRRQRRGGVPDHRPKLRDEQDEGGAQPLQYPDP